MQRSLFTAISGLNNHQTKLDVIGNNIANVNTTAFKGGAVKFSDILSQTLSGASAPQEDRGGINPMQVGLGMQVAAILNNHTQGNLQSTGREMDMAIQGNGFFVVSDGTQNFYTRDGSFSRGSDGYITNSTTGMHVMGWSADEDGNIDSSQPLSNLNIPLGFKSTARATQGITFGGNFNSATFSLSGNVATAQEGKAAVNSEFSADVGDADAGNFILIVDGVSTGEIPFDATEAEVKDEIEALGEPYLGNVNVTLNGPTGWDIEFDVEAAGAPVSVSFDAGNLETGGVVGGQSGDGVIVLAEGSAAINELQQISLENATGGTFTLTYDGETTDPIAYNAAAAEIRTALEALPGITDGDVLVTGISGDWDISFAGSLAGTDLSEMSMDLSGLESSYPIEMEIYDSLGNAHTLEIMFEKTGVNSWSWNAGLQDGGSLLGDGSGIVTFDEMGSVIAGEQGVFSINPIPAGSSLDGAEPLQIMLDFSALSQYVGETDAVMRQQDGFPMGILDSFNVSGSGVIMGSYSNGMVTGLGQIALGRFENPEGLIKFGDNMWQTSANSGNVFIGTPETQGRGKIVTSTLEMSNVNIAYEFTEMITTSRAFQANSRVITASDELLQEVVNLKR